MMLLFALIYLIKANDCGLDIKNLLENDISEAMKIFYYNGRDFDDLGNYEMCNKEASMKYALALLAYDIGNMHLGLCIPKTCSTIDLQKNLLIVFNQPSLKFNLAQENIKIIYSKEYNESPLSPSAIISIMILSVLVVINVCGTLIDSKIINFKKESALIDALKEFSIGRNIKKLVTIPEKTDTLTSINGIRVLSVYCILTHHVFTHTPQTSFSNLLETIDLYSDFPHKFYMALRIVVDIFFVISGFLLSYIVIPELHKQKSNYSWMKFIIHRILRLTPLYYTAIVIGLFIMRYLGSGPQWPLHDEQFHEACQTYWWTNFLYIQNLIPYNSYPCLSWTWYVSSDLHFFIVSPLILYSYYRKKIFGYLMCLLFILINLAYIGILSTVYEFSPINYGGRSLEFQVSLIYMKSQARISAFIIGIMIGFLYLKHLSNLKRSEKDDINLIDNTSEVNHTFSDSFENFCLKLVTIKCLRIMLYIIGIIMMLSAELTSQVLDDNGNDYWNQNSKSAFLAFQRLTTAIGFAFCFLPLLLGHCSGARKFFSLGIFIILARITFAIYLIHPILLRIHLFSRSQRVFITDMEMLHTSASLAVIASIAAGILCVLVEIPFLSLERKYFRG